MDLYVTLIGKVYLVTIILYKKAMELFWYCDGKLVVTVNRLTYKIGVSHFYSGWLSEIANNIDQDQTTHLEKLIKVNIVCCRDKISLEASSANSMGQDQTTPLGAAWSWLILFACSHDKGT